MSVADMLVPAPRRLQPASDCPNCRQHVERIRELELQVERLTRAIQREADHHWDNRTTNTGR